MSFVPEENPEFDTRHQRESHQGEGMSSTTKVLLVVTGIFGVMALACCGGVFYLGQQIKMDQSDDPADVQAALETILPATIPDRFEPLTSMEMNVVVTRMSMVAYRAKGVEKSGLALMRMGMPIAQMDAEEMKQQMRVQNPNQQNLKNIQSEEVTYDVDGREISVTFSHGELEMSPGANPDDVGKEWYSVISLIPVDDGFVMFTASGPEEEFDREEIDQVIESFELDSEQK